MTRAFPGIDDEDCGYSDPWGMGVSVTKLITVHGTNAGDPSDEGEHWWQKDSPFQKRLAEWLNLEGVEIEPFHWGEGPNSEVKRREAGSALLTRLKQYDKAAEDYYLIGHSHGGSVIHHALVSASTAGTELRRLRSWLTIGTPFLWTKPNGFLFRRLGNIGKVAYIMIFTSLVGLPLQLLMVYLYGRALYRASFASVGDGHAPSFLDPDAYAIAQVGGSVLFLIATIFIILRSQRRMRLYYASKTRDFFMIHFAPRWRCLRSQADEAINALQATKPLKLTLFRRNLLVHPSKALIVLVYALISVTGLIWTAAILYRYGLSTEMFAKSMEFSHKMSFGLVPQVNVEWSDLSDPVDILAGLAFYLKNPLYLILGLFILLLGGLTFFGFVWLVLSILGLAAYLIGFPTSWILNRITADQVRRTAFGNDTIGETVTKIAAVPEGCDPNCGLVPEEIEAVLVAFSDKHAVKTLESARRILGLDKEAQGERDVAKIIAEQMSWHELIHTAYFDVDEFAKLIAYVLHKAGLAPLSESFKADPDFEKAKVAYAGLAAVQPVKAAMD
jgi:hypothetical protein